MKVDIDVLGAFTMNGVVGQGDAALVVFVDGGGGRLGHGEVGAETAEPGCFVTSVADRHKFGFGGAGGDAGLLFGAPGDARCAEEEDPSTNGAASVGALSPVGVGETAKGGAIGRGRECQVFRRGAAQVTEEVFNCGPMSRAGILAETAEHGDGVRDVGTSELSQVQEGADCRAILGAEGEVRGGGTLVVGEAGLRIHGGRDRIAGGHVEFVKEGFNG